MTSPGPAKDDTRVSFLVVGSPRSGTTLVQRLACELPGVRMPAETHFFSQFAPGLLERRRFPIEESALRDELGRFAALETSEGLGLDPEAVVAELGGKCSSAFELFEVLVREISGPAQLWGEKTPDHLMWWRPISLAAPWMRFVVVLRDPRAVVASTLDMPWREDAGVPAWGEKTHLAFAERWNCLWNQAKKLRSELGEKRCLFVRYEDVVADPDATRARLAEFLGRSRPNELQDAPETIVLPWEPWKKEALGPVNAGRVVAWAEELGPRRAGEVAAVTRSGLRALGYSQSVPNAAEAAGILLRLGPRNIGRLVLYRRTFDGYLEAIERRSV